MPVFRRAADVEISYEEYGAGYPLLLFAPGQFDSTIAWWRHRPSDPHGPAPWIDPTVALAGRFRVIAMDQRNAGRSFAPIRASDDWGTYAEDHLALLDHLEIDRTHLMGCCIGASFCLRLCRDAPERVGAAVLQNPIGRAGNIDLLKAGMADWREAIRERHPEAGDDVFAAFNENMHRGDFAFSVTRDEVARCDVPLLVLPGDDAAHPASFALEIVRSAPRAELMQPWKGAERHPEQTRRVTEFLLRNTPSAA